MNTPGLNTQDQGIHIQNGHQKGRGNGPWPPEARKRKKDTFWNKECIHERKGERQRAKAREDRTRREETRRSPGDALACTRCACSTILLLFAMFSRSSGACLSRFGPCGGKNVLRIAAKSSFRCTARRRERSQEGKLLHGAAKNQG